MLALSDLRRQRQGRIIPRLAIEYAVTADMNDGQPLPPFIEDGRVWHVVSRADGRTLWRRLFLTSSSSPVIVGARRRRIKHERLQD